MKNQTMKDEEEKAALLAALDSFLEQNNPPKFLRGGNATFSVSFDGGKTFKEIGQGCIGDIRIEPRRPGTDFKNLTAD